MEFNMSEPNQLQSPLTVEPFGRHASQKMIL